MKLTVRFYQPYSQLLVARLFLFFVSPWNRVNCEVVFPGLHANDTFGKVGEIIQGTRHRAEYTRDTLLPRHACVNASLWPTTSAAA